MRKTELVARQLRTLTPAGFMPWRRCRRRWSGLPISTTRIRGMCIRLTSRHVCHQDDDSSDLAYTWANEHPDGTASSRSAASAG